MSAVHNICLFAQLPQPSSGQLGSIVTVNDGAGDGSYEDLVSMIGKMDRTVQRVRQVLKQRQQKLKLVKKDIAARESVRKQEDAVKKVRQVEKLDSAQVRMVTEMAKLKWELRQAKTAAADRKALATTVATQIEVIANQEKQLLKLQADAQEFADRQKILKTSVESERVQRQRTAQLLVDAQAQLEMYPARVALLEKEKSQRDKRIVDLSDEVAVLRGLSSLRDANEKCREEAADSAAARAAERASLLPAEAFEAGLLPLRDALAAGNEQQEALQEAVAVLRKELEQAEAAASRHAAALQGAAASELLLKKSWALAVAGDEPAAIEEMQGSETRADRLMRLANPAADAVLDAATF